MSELDAAAPECGLSSSPALNRRVRIAVAPGEVRASVEDDFHHFRVAVRHDGARIIAISADSLRFPYSLCPDAGDRLVELVDAPLTARAIDVFRMAEPRLQCTHQFDLAALAIAAAARGSGRDYTLQVPDPVEGRTRARAWERGRLLLSWDVERYSIVAPAPFSGLGLGSGFTDWVARNLNDDDGEAALVLRRGVFISRGRRIMEAIEKLGHAPATGGCWVHQPERAESATRQRGSVRDFSGSPEALAADDDAWLSFQEGESG